MALITEASLVGGEGRHVNSPILRMRKVRLRRGAVSGEIQYLLIVSCVLGSVKHIISGPPAGITQAQIRLTAFESP